MQSLKDKVVLVTGASSGIGAAIALKFAEFDSRLVLVARNKERLEAVASKCSSKSYSNHVSTYIGDLTSPEVWKGLIDHAITQYGQLDVLIIDGYSGNVNCVHLEKGGVQWKVNNAGIGPMLTFADTKMEAYDDIFNINTRAVFGLTQLAVPHLLKTKGNIVNISSICGQRPMTEMMVYSMSKAALDTFTKCLALDLAPQGVRVNVVNPGTTKSGAHKKSMNLDDEGHDQLMERLVVKHPLGRVGNCEEVADVVLFLASDLAKFVTGQLMFVDGGRHLVNAPVLPK